MADKNEVRINMDWAEGRDWWPRYSAKVKQYLTENLTMPKELDLELRRAELGTETYMICRELLTNAAQQLHEAGIPPESDEADELFNEAAWLYQSLLTELGCPDDAWPEGASRFSEGYQSELRYYQARGQRHTESFFVRMHYTLSGACRYHERLSHAHGFVRQVWADWPPGMWAGQRLRPTTDPLDDTFRFPIYYRASKFRSDRLDKILILTYVGNGMANYVLPFSNEAKLIEEQLKDPNALYRKVLPFASIGRALGFLVIPITAYLLLTNFTDLSEGAIWMGLVAYLAWQISGILGARNLWPIKEPLIAGTDLDALRQNLTEIDAFREDYYHLGLPTHEPIAVDDLRRKLMAFEARGVRWAPMLWVLLDDLSARGATVV